MVGQINGGKDRHTDIGLQPYKQTDTQAGRQTDCHTHAEMSRHYNEKLRHIEADKQQRPRETDRREETNRRTHPSSRTIRPRVHKVEFFVDEFGFRSKASSFIDRMQDVVLLLHVTLLFRRGSYSHATDVNLLL